MNDYTKGILTGASLILCFFMFVSAKSQSKNLGDITVNSLSVAGENGELMLALGSINKGGVMAFYNSSGKTIMMIGANDGGSGSLAISNANEKTVAYLAPIEQGGGVLQIFNEHEVQVGYFGTSKNNDGIALLYDRDGDTGWVETGKK